ncbi:MAG: hypothetical protein Q8P41_29585 [Pseudomonadota bacterium]|nr:hypothetical protein [Pseudomonadota bacterium]
MESPTPGLNPRTFDVGLGGLFLLVAFGLFVLPGATPGFAGVAVAVLLALAGAGEVVFGLFGPARGWAVSVLLGAVALATALLLFADPAHGMFGLSLLGGLYLVGAGGLRMGVALLWHPGPAWGWMLGSGLVGFAIGLALLAAAVPIGPWALGALVGVDLLTAGLALTRRGVAGLTTLAPAGDRMLPL